MFSGAEERRAGSFPWCSRPARQQAEEQIHQHPPLWVTDSEASWLKEENLSIHIGLFKTQHEAGFVQFVCVSVVHVAVTVAAFDSLNVSLQTTSVGWSWSRCTTTKVQTTSTPTTSLWVTADRRLKDDFSQCWIIKAETSFHRALVNFGRDFASTPCFLSDLWKKKMLNTHVVDYFTTVCRSLLHNTVWSKYGLFLCTRNQSWKYRGVSDNLIGWDATLWLSLCDMLLLISDWLCKYWFSLKMCRILKIHVFTSCFHI